MPNDARLTDDEQQLIRDLRHKSGWSAPRIADIMGVSVRTVYRILQTREERTIAQHEDALWLLECGEHPEEVARRVGTTLTALYSLLRRRPTPAEYLRRVSAETARVRAMERAA